MFVVATRLFDKLTGKYRRIRGGYRIFKCLKLNKFESRIKEDQERFSLWFLFDLSFLHEFSFFNLVSAKRSEPSYELFFF